MMSLKNFILKQNWKKLFVFCLVIWVGLNIFQALCTEILDDETYYFCWSEHLAWGYFDHPPMIALMIHISSLLFDGNLSVRFITIVMQFLTLLLIWKLIDEKEVTSRKVTLFFIICFSMVMLQAYGIATTPDAPLLFFSSLFLFAYKRFIEKNSWIDTLLLAVSMSGMIYSKYHAFLIIGLIVLSNLRLLLKYKFWIAVIVTALVLIPHVKWQISMDFPTLKYHLSERNQEFSWIYFLEYLPNQLIVFNPFVFGAVIYIFIKYRANGRFERALYFLCIGFLVFFWTMSLRGHVEPHWTVVCTIPMIILLYRRSLQNAKLMKYVKYFVLPSIILVFATRIVFITDWLPDYMRFHGKENECKAIESIAGNLPVVFVGSFQNPSNYHFFTGKQATTLPYMHMRSTQFDIWQDELKWQGKPVFVCYRWSGKSQKYNVNGDTIDGFFAKKLQTVSRLKIDYKITQKEIHVGDTLTVDFTISNPTKFDINFKHDEFPVTWNAVFIWGERVSESQLAGCVLLKPIDVLRANETLSGTLKITVPDLPKPESYFTITLNNTILAAKNSKFISLKIKK